MRVAIRPCFAPGTSGAIEQYVQGLAGALSRLRGPAPTAQALYEETPASIAARLARAAERKLNPDPALAIEQGRPTKRDRRQLADWDRWSASADPD